GVNELPLRALRFGEREPQSQLRERGVAALLGLSDREGEIFFRVSVVAVQQMALAFRAVEVALAMPPLEVRRCPGGESRSQPEDPQDTHGLSDYRPFRAKTLEGRPYRQPRPFAAHKRNPTRQ